MSRISLVGNLIPANSRFKGTKTREREYFLHARSLKHPVGHSGEKDRFGLIEEAYSYFLAVQIKYIVVAPSMEIHQKYFEYGLVIIKYILPLVS